MLARMTPGEHGSVAAFVQAQQAAVDLPIVDGSSSAATTERVARVIVFSLSANLSDSAFSTADSCSRRSTRSPVGAGHSAGRERRRAIALQGVAAFATCSPRPSMSK